MPARRTAPLVVASATALAVAGALVFLTVRFAANNPDEVNLGKDVFELRARRLSAEIAERGPALFKDPLDRGREVYLQHLGTDPKKGWLAIRAYASEARLACLLQWRAGTRRFVDPCTKRSYPPDGDGLTTYPATVTGDTVRVDLRTARPARPAGVTTRSRAAPPPRRTPTPARSP